MKLSIALTFASILSVFVSAQDRTFLDSLENNILVEGERIVSASDPAVSFSYRKGGSIAIEISGKSFRETASVYVSRNFDSVMKLEQNGHLVVYDIDGIPVWTSPGEDSENFPFVLTVDGDRRARLRDLDENVLWSFPPARTNILNLDSNGMNYLRSGEAISSPDGEYSISLDERGVLRTTIAGTINQVPVSVKNDFRALLLTPGGRLVLKDSKGAIRWNSTNVEPGVANGPYIMQVNENGEPEVLDGNNVAIWKITKKPTNPVSPSPTNNVGPSPTITPQASGWGWDFYDGFNIEEHDLGRLDRENRNDCQPLCRNALNCIGYTWAHNVCYFKQGPKSTINFKSNTADNVYSALINLPNPTFTGYGFDFYDNFDIVGNDLSQMQASDRNNCQPRCFELTGCVGYTWSGNVCYFKKSPKSAVTNILPLRGVYSALIISLPLPSSSGWGHDFWDNFDIKGHDLDRTFSTTDRNQCQPRCSSTANCVGYTWAGNVCYFKKGPRSAIPGTDFIRANNVYSALLV